MNPISAPAPRKRWLMPAVLVTGAISTLISLFILYGGNPVRGLFTPSEVKEFVFLSTATSTGRTSVATVGGFDASAFEALNTLGSVESFARGGGVSAAIVRPQRSMVSEVVHMEAEGIVSVASSTVEKRAVAVSPDGAYIAWSEAANLPEGIPYSASTDTWDVQLWSRTDGSIRTIGQGYGPQFLNAETVLFTTSEHLATVALPDGEAEPQPYPGISSIAMTAKASAGFLLVPITDRSVYLAYRVTSARPLATESLGELPESFHDVAIGKEGIYGLLTEEGRKAIVRMSYADLGEVAPVLRFPDALPVITLIP